MTKDIQFVYHRLNVDATKKNSKEKWKYILISYIKCDILKDFIKDGEYMAYNKEAQKRYREKSIQFAVNYRPGTDIQDGQRIKAYLEQTGQSANSYIKDLIKRDLDSKGFMVDNMQ